jgi:hypothetical protein
VYESRVVGCIETRAGIMKVALMVAEKPSLAASLANILSNGKNSSKKGKKSHTVGIMETPWLSCRFIFGCWSHRRANPIC